MLLYNIFTAICLALLVGGVAYVVVSLAIKKTRSERIAYIRGFKMGKCAAIFLVCIPLYMMGLIYSGKTVFNSFFEALAQIFNTVVLRFSFTAVEELMAANAFYAFTIYFCFVLVIINGILFTLSLIGQRLWYWKERVKRALSKKDKLYVFGYNNDSLSIYNSDTHSCKVIVDDFNEELRTSMYFNKTSYLSCKTFDVLIDKIFDGACKKSTLFTVVINTQSDDKNIALCNTFIDRIKSVTSDKSSLYQNLRVFVFGDPQYADIYNDIVDRAEGCVHYVNKYQKIAIGFIDRYPFSKFMDERHLDYNTACVREGVDLNVCMIGFGKVNQQIFLTSVANNQFITKGANGAHIKPVSYHIFDKLYSENNKNLNHNYYRFRNECSDVDATKYLPFPELPATEQYHHLDINDTRFYNQIRQIVTKSANDVNFVIISYGTDLENIDMARKLIAKRREWNVDNLVIFVRIRNWRKSDHLFDDTNCFVFGDDKTDVYNVDEIVRDKIFRMAHMRNELYALEYDITHKSKEDVVNSEFYAKSKANADVDWYKNKIQIERESNLYCCLSLRSKLNMIGLDYCDASDDSAVALSEEQYLERYAKDDVITWDENNVVWDDVEHHDATARGKYSVVWDDNGNPVGKKVVDYPLDFADSLRTNFAKQEHYRWNSFIISQGLIPATIDQILTDKIWKNGRHKLGNGKNYPLRRHGNLTTFEGLEQFRKLVAERDNGTEKDADVIKYDYQIMDDAYWLLNRNGFKIVEKRKI